MVELVVPVSVRDLSADDLTNCAWAGTPIHLTYVRTAVERAQRGEVDYLAICPPSDLPVAIGGIDYSLDSQAGTLWQLMVHPALRSCGLGTRLIKEAEQRIRARGWCWSRLSVEDDNPRAQALYKRLGYVAYDRQRETWNIEADDGTITRHETVCTLMRKSLA